ncbi:biotin transporter BioY [Halorubellus sp. PRR65]|uniref:biotin transporter BioY n=1 Tax=Halorubellus sp. PRR65 TaxID=3098148 RepID=UPI002B260034|nr:biotin transporter BioY [Halorubellus sp. PRR65]
MSTQTENVDLVPGEVAVNVARAAMLAALVGAFAYVSFPNPVSPAANVTLQVLGVFLAGALLGPLWGGASLLLYLVAGALGAPIFSGGAAGFGHLVGATGGYLLSYPVAAALVGAVAHGGLAPMARTEIPVWRLVAGMVAGTVVIYALGMGGLMVVAGYSLSKAFAVGAAAFIPAELVKLAAAVGIVRSDALAVE